jgi:hypothetical protein
MTGPLRLGGSPVAYLFLVMVMKGNFGDRQGENIP